MYSKWWCHTQLGHWNRTNNAFEMWPYCEAGSYHAAPRVSSQLITARRKIVMFSVSRQTDLFSPPLIRQCSLTEPIRFGINYNFMNFKSFEVQRWVSDWGIAPHYPFQQLPSSPPIFPTNCTFSGASISRELAILFCRSRNFLSTHSLHSYRGCQGISCVIVTVCSSNCFSPVGLRRWEIGFYATLDSLSFICLSTV